MKVELYCEKSRPEARHAALPPAWRVLPGAGGASVGQAVKVKAETSPDLQTLPLLDPVQLDRTTPEYRVPKPPEPRRKEGERKKKKK